MRQAHYWRPARGRGRCLLDAALRLARHGHSPGVRRLAVEFGAPLPFASAAVLLAATAAVGLSAGTIRAATEADGERREAAAAAEAWPRWRDGPPPAAGAAPPRL